MTWRLGAPTGHSFVNLPMSVAADLALLTDILDSSSSDIVATLSGLVAATAQSVPSLVGLALHVGGPQASVEITTIDESAHARIRTSLRFPLLDGSGHDAPIGALLVFASQPGALVDLAADLTWLTGRPLGDARLDEDLDARLAQPPELSLALLSTVNQAVGVLIGGGLTEREARVGLDARALVMGVERHVVAAAILAATRGDSS
jgi:hypothetical protein